MKRKLKQLHVPLTIICDIFFKILPDCEVMIDDEEIILTAKCTNCMKPCKYLNYTIQLQDVYCKSCTGECFIKCGHYGCNCMAYVQAKYGLGLTDIFDDIKK